jgi:putative multiple sugar transport system ATP-binding protein
MNDGAFVGEFDGRDATQEQIMRTIMRNERIARSFGQARRVGELQS